MEVKKLQIAPATLSSTTVTLIWEKPEAAQNCSGYFVSCNGVEIAKRKTRQTHITIENLVPSTNYSIVVKSISYNEGKSSGVVLEFVTLSEQTIINVTKPPFLLDDTGKMMVTEQLQQAINICPENGIVYLPAGGVFLTGALQLKSNMTLRIDGILQGSSNSDDYRFNLDTQIDYGGSINEDGLILSRYEGWELYCYRSLINSGYVNSENRYEVTCENIRVNGSGRIIGGGNDLGLAMREIYSDTQKYPRYLSDNRPGRRVRGRLVNFVQTKNIELTGVSIENPPCWTVHMIYCDSITTHGVTIRSQGVDNGDGWDPDSSRNCIIFDTTFDTGDDCIAIKSGKNPDGNIINIPTENVRIFDLEMKGGHGMAIGSEQSGGVRGVSLRDCRIENTMFGLELKAHNDRGGFIEDVTVKDSTLDCFLAHSVNYNSDGVPANNLPKFKNISLDNVKLTNTGTVIELVGFESRNRTSLIENVTLKDIILNRSETASEIQLALCRNLSFNNVTLTDGGQPNYAIDRQSVTNINRN